MENETVVNYFLIKKPKQGPERRHGNQGAWAQVDGAVRGLGDLAGGG